MAKPRSFLPGTSRLRLVLALTVLGLFIYAYCSGSLSSNRVLALVVKDQFSALLYRSGILGLTVIGILGLTLIFGRLYCSVLCPLGTLQELLWRGIAWLRRKGRGKSPPRSSPASGSSASPSAGAPPPQGPRLFRGGYASPPRIRYLIPLIVGAGAAFSFSPLMMILDPISIFGRGMGAVRGLLEGEGLLFGLIRALPLILVLIFAVFRGRAFCTWCPVGLTLGLCSWAAPFSMKISSRCVSCGLCEKRCPAGCINAQEKRLDRERCVLCSACAGVCPSGSVSYGWRRGADPEASALFDPSRRMFLKGAGKATLICGAAYLLGPSLKLFSLSPGGRLGNLTPETLPILPPGAKNLRHYQSHCVGCQACVASCPVGIIKPEHSPHPVLHYTRAGCQFNCLECGTVCPTGAITRITLEEKRRTRVALSSLAFERCVVNTKRESCGACAEVCPTGALTMTAYRESMVPWLTRPVFDERYCIGCGACLVACPAEPPALGIGAVQEQTLTAGVRPPEEAGDELRIHSTEDFPF